jgi:putative CocE/NonD family hydrolase
MNSLRSSLATAQLIFFLTVCFLVSNVAVAQQQPIQQQYSKRSVRISMRDGKKLFTTIYQPRDRSKKYPIMINRTPYSTQPYGDQYARRIAPSKLMQDEGYIFVHQDVRGRWMSEGDFDNMRPNVDNPKEIDESSDTYDTIDWLVDNVEGNNGKVGIWGVSYPGFYSAAALPDHHPALVASSPQAPISDFFFDDFHHHGAYLLSYFTANSTFGFQHAGPTNQQWYQSIKPGRQDPWSFYLSLGPMSEAGRLHKGDFFWQQIVDHPNYDEFWQRRSILPHLKDIKTNVLVVGGFFDAEDLYGPLNIYRSIESKNPDTFNAIVMGPWSHGDWSHQYPIAKVGKVAFGSHVSQFYQEKIEAPFFRHFLKGVGPAPNFEAIVYDCGVRKWREYDQWPPANAKPTKFYLRNGKTLSQTPPAETDTASTSFVSDPDDPVPYRDRRDLTLRFTPRPYMSDDQRFATARPDVLTFQTAPLTTPLTLTGDLMAHLNVSTTGTSADWVVKLIDVYPDDHPFVAGSDLSVNFGGFQQMVRSEVIRGRFRNSYEQPEPFVAGEVAEINLPLQDVCHTFKKGHRIMVHVQSTWFPLIDRNPQKYVDNIFKAKAEDFIKATHTLHHSQNQPSWIEMKVSDAK